MGADQAAWRGRVLAGDRRHVAVRTGPGLVGVVERAGALSRYAARLPVVVAVETPQPAVVVDRLVEVHLVAGRAEGRAVAGVERLQERLAVGFGVQVDDQVVKRPEQRILRGGEVVHLRVLDDEPGVPHRVLHAGDRVAGNAAESRARGGTVHDLGERPVHEPAEEHRVVVAARAPLRGGDAHDVLHVFDRAAVPGVVEGRETMRRLAPLVGDVGVAAAARVAAEEELLGDEPAVERFRRRREERSVRPAHRLAGHGRGRQPGVQERAGRREQRSQEGACRDGDGQQQRREQQAPPGEQPREPGGGGEVGVEKRPALRSRSDDGEPQPGERQQGSRGPEPPPQGIGSERGPDLLPPPEHQFQRRDAEHRVQQDLGGVEEVRSPRGQQVSGIDQQQGCGGDQEPVAETQDGPPDSTPASRSAFLAIRVIRIVTSTKAASPTIRNPASSGSDSPETARATLLPR